MLCPNCRAANPEHVLFCGQCGTRLGAPEGGQTAVMDGPASTAAASVVPKPATVAGVLSPPPVSQSETWGGGAFGGTGAVLQPGSAFGPRYRIEALLGEGGMGAVYKAYDTEIERPVALKLIRPELAASTQAMQRFKQELLLASRISHKNILRIHDLGEVNGVKFISMALVEGEDLYALLSHTGPLPLDRALHFARQLCAALDAADSEGVVHRDLKPQNLLIDRAGNLCVSDFGLAKSLEAEAATMTRTGQILGTPRYMSPEQVEARPADHRSDLYAVGLILYEMVAGEAPFAGESTLQMMYQRVHQPPEDPRRARPDLPDWFAAVILKCLERDPARRYQHAHEILADLDAARAPAQPARPAAEPPRSIVITLPRSKRSRRLLAAGVGALALAGMLAVPAVRHLVFRGAPAAGTARPAAPRRYVAVLPFRVLDQEAALKYAAEGVVEALAAKLSGLQNVYVASSAAVEAARNKPTLQATARSLGVNLLVQGTVQATGEKVYIAVSLEDTRTGRRLWTGEFTGLRQDLLTIEDQIYGKLVTALEVKPSNEELARSTVRPTEDIGAYDLYLRSRNVTRGRRDAKTLETALAMYDQAVKKDPGFALAYAGMSDAYLSMWELSKDSVWTERALGAAQQADRLNDGLPEVHFALGSVYTATGRNAQAIAELRRALDLAPNADDGHRRLGNAYLAAGRTEEAFQAFQRAIAVNPYYWLNHNQLGAAYFTLGKNREAMAAFRRVTELEPDRASGWANVGAVYFREGRWDECIPAFRKAIELQPSPRYYSNLGVTYFYLGRYAEAAKVFEQAVASDPHNHVAEGNLADAYRWLGERQKAAAAYDQAIALAYQEFQVNPKKASTLGSLAVYYAKKGDGARALDFIRRARAIDRGDNALMYKEAVIAALAGHPDQAVASLREAFASGYSRAEARNDPELKTLKGIPAFETLLAQAGGR